MRERKRAFVLHWILMFLIGLALLIMGLVHNSKAVPAGPPAHRIDAVARLRSQNAEHSARIAYLEAELNTLRRDIETLREVLK